jgi:CspA family cold shock protein
MPQGTVRWFNTSQGSSFITPENGDDVFVHYSVIKNGGFGFRSLVKGEKVSFDVKQGPKGPSAVSVVKR